MYHDTVALAEQHRHGLLADAAATRARRRARGARADTRSGRPRRFRLRRW